MKTKWKVDNGTVARPNRFVRDEDEQIVAYCEGPLSQARIHAHLIAAAPDMLEALKHLVEMHESNRLTPLAFVQARAIIAKAERMD